MKPTKCHLWQKENLTSNDLHIGTTFEIVKTFEDESHSIRRILKCKDCGQLYFYDFYEEIDWVNGEDPQWRKYYPFSEDSKIDLNLYIASDWPSTSEEPTIKWVGK